MRPICLSLCLCFCLGLVLGGCLSGASDTPSVALVLKPGDALRITVAGEEELSGGFIVNSDGSVRLPLLGTVPAAGLSPATFQAKLQQLLGSGYLKNPQVAVERLATPPQ